MEKEKVLVAMFLNLKTHNFTLVNLDTDSVSFCKKDGTSFTEEEQLSLLQDLNSHFPDKIRWEHDGLYDKVVVLKAKNYILYDSNEDDRKKIKKKGSSLKSSKTEKALKEFMDEIIECLIFDKQHELVNIYNKYIKEVHNIKDISRWCSKKTLTESVLNPTRTNEQKILDSIEDENLQMGDKIWLYFTEETSSIEVPKYRKGQIVGYTTKEVKTYPLKLQKNWTGDHSIDKLIAKIYKTLLIFKNVINIEQFPKYHLKNKKVKKLLNEMLKNV